MLTQDTRIVPMTLLAQAAVSAALAVPLGLWQGKVVGLSVLLGGMIAVVPNAFLAARILPQRSTPAAMLRAVWLGELGKWLLTALLFGAVFALVRPLSAPGIFAGFIAAQLTVFWALLFRGEPAVGAGSLRELKKS